MSVSAETTVVEGRPPRQLSTETEQLFRASYDGSAAVVRRLAQQYHVADSTVRAWARQLGLTRRSRPRTPSPSHQLNRPSQRIVLPQASEEKQAYVVPDKETVDLLGTFLREVERYPLLTAQEERTLGERLLRGDLQVKQMFFHANLRLVIRIAKSYARRRSSCALTILDLIQEGAFGLLEACNRYDVHRGYRFSTMATWWIRQAISRAIQEQGRMIRLPVGMQEQMSDLQQLLKTSPEGLSLEEQAQQLGLSPERLQTLLEAPQALYSVDAPAFRSDEEQELGQFLEAPMLPLQEHVEANDLHQHLDDLLQQLPPRAARVIVLRFGLDGQGVRTLDAVGKELGVSRERVRQIEIRALQQLRLLAQARDLQEYLRL
ncbi:RNA polymerase sigma factor SigA [Reticulibacter mediterranei]|uniref:RNA polymerase sigma factor SigA n=1 Tax=Reticulibacter mediterranei TaxID=2778369 RepID=A0A8J3IUH6_9CHLR|nr:RNA polymerase sigma factor RpoD/SigA [Reticulibacter mediterranei]GHP00849.1 RNA polymerase sigma factor SigA [Reticulibacter mediterranei]